MRKVLVFMTLYWLSFFTASGAKSVAFPELLFGTCGNPCTIKARLPVSSPSFEIGYRIYKEGEMDFVDIKLNNRTFSGLEVSLNSAGRHLPFHQYRFFEDHRFGMYEMTSSSHISTTYSHYFVLDGSRFYYLGIFANLLYNENNDTFFAFEGIGRGEYWEKVYKLVENRFVEQEGGRLVKKNPYP